MYQFSSKTKKDEKETEKDEEVKPGIPNQKDKSLKDVDTKESDVYKDKTTGISDEEFKMIIEVILYLKIVVMN